MEFQGLRVLVLDGAGKQTLTMVRGLKELGCHVTVFCKSQRDTCYVSKYPDKKILSNISIEKQKEYTDYLLKLVSAGDFDVLMPIGELSTNPVTQREEEFKKYVKLACAPRDTYIKAFNKQITFDIAIENGIPCSYTRHSKQSIEDYLEKCSFPIIIKPRQGLGSIGFHKFEKYEEFWPYMKEKGLNPDDYVVQEYVDHERRLGTILFVDQKNNVCMSYANEVLRWFPIDAGSACMLRTIDYPDVITWSTSLLKAMKWQGIAALSFMVDKVTGEAKLLEINGRIPASIRLSSMCGFNVAKLLIELAYGEAVDQYPPNTAIGVCLRHFDTDLAWFFQSPDRFRADPSWFSWKNTKEVLYSKDDKKPFYIHLLAQLIEAKEKMRKKKH